ncbi:hypothetical protein K501DRAFT_234517 [Backusella circina FSU 941]|nr:hypothetical protein K501DRAFT_234517 [Backusella circina FSU 941]
MEGTVCIVFMTQLLCPRLFPFISSIKLPILVRLEFKETDTDSGLFKIATHEESWTVQGLVEAVPCLSFWYNTILRNMMGKIVSTTGSVIEAAQLMSARSLELEEYRTTLFNKQVQQKKN